MSDDSELYFLELKAAQLELNLSTTAPHTYCLNGIFLFFWLHCFNHGMHASMPPPFEIWIEHTSQQSDTTPLPT